MSENPRQRTRDKIRGLFGSSNRLPDRTNSKVARSANATSLHAALSADEPSARISGERFFELALQKLTAEERQTVLSHSANGAQDVTCAIDQAYNAALSKQQACESSRWRWTFRGKDISLREEAEKVLHGLDKFKSIGNVLANVDPLHFGLPWAGICFILEMTVVETRQMADLLTGMRLTMSIATRLQVYLAYYQRLPTMIATDNFERVLIQMYTHVLRFIATAIRTYQGSGSGRMWRATWETSAIEDFEVQCEKLGAEADIEASICERELFNQDREKAKHWKTELELSLQKLDHIAGLQSAVEDLHIKVDLSKLRTASGATYDSHADENLAHCLAGTRTELMGQVATWAKDLNGKNIFWLCGMAGTGKSTIARTVADRLNKKDQLGASFFFRRGEGDCGNASRFFPTIALQLSHKVPGMSRFIGEALDADSFLCERNLEIQFERLLLQPFLNATKHRQSWTMIIVVDALDECDNQINIRTILSLLARTGSVGKTSLRIFVTSRPETPIQTGFRSMDGALHEDVILEQVQTSSIQNDIRVYLRHRFQEICEEYALLQAYDCLPVEWPGDDRIEALVSLAEPLFIFAFTVCRYISQRDPQGRLESLLHPERGTSLSGLNQMYSTILEKMLLNQDVDGHAQVLDDFHTVVGSIAVLANPLSADSLANLLNVPLTVVSETLRPLHSVLYVPVSSASPIRLLHLSFREFLVNKHHLKSSDKFHVDESQVHTRLAQQCLQLLGQPGILSNDICKVTRPGTRRAEISTDHIAAYLLPDTAYACCYWVFHIIESKQELHDDGQVYRFLKQHFLHWLEALSWLGRLSGVIASINSLRSKAEGLQVSEFLEDAHRFVLHNRQMIDLAPLQTYHSALVFAPLESTVRQSFVNSSHQSFSVLPTVPSKWSAEILRIDGHDNDVTAIAFSPNGLVMASASADRKLRLWNLETGEQIKRLNSGVYGDQMAFSADGQKLTVLAFERNRLQMQIWNVQTGDRIWDYRHCEGVFLEAASSPNGQYIAIASNSRAVHIHNAKTGKLIHRLEGHSHVVTALVFALHGQIVAAGSFDGSMRLWDVASGVHTHTLSGHKDRITNLAVSTLDWQIIASTSEDRTVRLWNACTGAQVHMIWSYGESIASLAFSPDSKILALASREPKVRLWDTAVGKDILSIENEKEDCIEDGRGLDTLTVNGGYQVVMAFSPVEQRLAVAIDGRNIRMWDTRTGVQTHILQGHMCKVTAMAFSFDGFTMASTSNDRTIRLWDVSTGSEKVTIKAFAEILAFSLDGEMMATSRRKTVEFWSTRTGELLRTLEHIKPIYGLTFLALDGYVAASFSEDCPARVWDAQTGMQLWELGKDHFNTEGAAFSPNDRMIASSSGGTEYLWNAYTGHTRHKFRGSDCVIIDVTFLRDGQFVALTTLGGPTVIWSVETGHKVHELQTPRHDKELSKVIALSPDSQLVASFSHSAIRLHNTRTGENITELIVHRDDISEMIFSPVGTSLAVASERTLCLWDISTAQQTHVFEGHNDSVSAIAFSPDGWIVASASRDSTVRLWHTKFDGQMQGHDGEDSNVTVVGFSPDGQTVASGSRDQTVRLWDASTGKMKQKLEGHNGIVTALAFSPDGLVLASASFDQMVRLWSARTGDLMQVLKDRQGLLAEVVFSPDGQVLASVATWRGVVSLWNVETAVRIWTMSEETGGIRPLVFSPDGQFVAIAATVDIVSVLNVENGERIQRFSAVRFTHLAALCFSPDSKVVVSAARSGLHLWNAQTGEKLQKLQWPHQIIQVRRDREYEFVFSKNGQWVQTPFGMFGLDWEPSTSLLRPLLERTVNLELTDQWIRHWGEDLLYLPHGYRGPYFDTFGDTLVVGQASGAVNFFRLLTSP